MSRLPAVIAIIACTAAPAPAGVAPEAIERPAVTILEGSTIRHPGDYLTLGFRLFREGRRDEGVFWFYVGQLRYRALIAAHPTLSPVGPPATFAAMIERMGATIDDHAFADPAGLARTVEQVLAWDAANADPFTSKTRYGADRERVRQGFAAFRDRLIAVQSDIRAKRTALGLATR